MFCGTCWEKTEKKEEEEGEALRLLLLTTSLSFFLSFSLFVEGVKREGGTSATSLGPTSPPPPPSLSLGKSILSLSSCLLG